MRVSTLINNSFFMLFCFLCFSSLSSAILILIRHIELVALLSQLDLDKPVLEGFEGCVVLAVVHRGIAFRQGEIGAKTGRRTQSKDKDDRQQTKLRCTKRFLEKEDERSSLPRTKSAKSDTQLCPSDADDDRDDEQEGEEQIPVEGDKQQLGHSGSTDPFFMEDAGTEDRVGADLNDFEDSSSYAEKQEGMQPSTANNPKVPVRESSSA